MIKDIILFAKVEPSAIIPNKKKEDAGYDFYANFEDDNLIIPPLSSKLIPTGIASAFTNDWVLYLVERGSTGVRNMKKSAGVIDSGFRGEIFVCLYNGNTKPIIITKETNIETLKILEEDYVVYPYRKAICQGLLLPVPNVSVQEISNEELVKIPSERGLGRLGSSNK